MTATTPEARTDRRTRLLTGVQALPRILVEQHARDAAAGRRTRSFVSGYQGSPLGGVESAFQRDPDTERSGIRFVPGLNEELAATAVWGSQQVLPDQSMNCDGVVGMWFGKAPGLDRSADALRHANLSGANPAGGMLLMVGDDPAAKSSTLPCASERTLSSLLIPVLAPRDGAEVITLGLHGIALSRATGFLVALKIVTDVADGLWEVPEPGTDQPPATVPDFEWEGLPWHFRQLGMPLMPYSARSEADLVGPRTAALARFTEEHPVDAVELDPEQAWLGIAAAGKIYDDTVQALADLGLDADGCARAGIRLLRIGMPWPLQPGPVHRLARGVETLLVVEEKTAFVETQIRNILYGGPDRPAVIGAQDAAGRPLVPSDGELTAGRITGALRRVLHGRVEVSLSATPMSLPVLGQQRTAFFCSGCPHNRSTVVPEGSLVGAGIGCHGLAAGMPHLADKITGVTQMGGEGTQWIGQTAFHDVGHIFQNIGDGTFFHSGQLAVQACVAAGVNITFKLLYNGTVAMTGGQDPSGQRSVASVTRSLLAQGVSRIIVCTDEPQRYAKRDRRDPLGRGVVVRDRARLDEAQRELRDTKGVTVLIYDQQCAAEARRDRKRGRQPERTTRIVINERICEGCGDCGAKSNCLSVEPVDTEFGRKTRIEQTSCNTDYSCLDGDCPSFVSLDVSGVRKAERSRAVPPAVPEPELPSVGDGFDLFLSGIGGTGIVTVNRVLAAAAELDGLHTTGLDQTGLSQKAGPVSSHLRVTRTPAAGSNRVSPGSADAFLAFDLLTAVGQLGYADPGRTRVIGSTSRVPTGAMVRDPDTVYPESGTLRAQIGASAAMATWLDAVEATTRLCGSAQSANLMLVGAAYQAGALPMSEASILAAIERNKVAVEANRTAFAWGRVAVADTAAFAAATGTERANDEESLRRGERILGSDTPLRGETRRLSAVRAGELYAFQNARLAQRYVDMVVRAWEAERAVTESTEFSEAVAEGLFHLTAVKDEYETARLMNDSAFRARLDAEFPGARRARYLLHPPVLRALGRKKKIGIPIAFAPAFRVLAAGKVLRNTPLDLFGRTGVRRAERALRNEYWALVDALIQRVRNGDNEDYRTAVAAAEAAQLVRGYEQVRMRGIERFHRRLAELGLGDGELTPVADREAGRE
ncbi:indolepyruvate ferredoxin oxidoreductase family protein [Streptomyces justiciae]|uniref:indolepyruvate ferredoxin oxidoreductase family protein n=1 Tax=Streptomyces justiciae TaxID=2780140 RepID=UPI0021193235|nr:indolepyruvate ferredoxin oxidoreductase family protein [Streptomyces justiciae]MCW8378656.1 indolepyruvate ferredoxin oxidoreductase family protein [Streptomyces justiciae]